MSYKRLTNNNLEEYNPEYDFCVGCKYFGEPNGCNRPNGTCANYERFIETYNRLAELEDKIEQKKMLELPFLVGQDAFIIEDNEIVMGVVNGIWWQNEFLIEVRYGKDTYGWRYAQRLKDGIFSTKAEAEKKL